MQRFWTAKRVKNDVRRENAGILRLRYATASPVFPYHSDPGLMGPTLLPTAGRMPVRRLARLLLRQAELPVMSDFGNYV